VPRPPAWEAVSLKDGGAWLVRDRIPELAALLDGSLLPFLKDINIATFMRHKILKRKHENDEEGDEDNEDKMPPSGPSSKKRTKRSAKPSKPNPKPKGPKQAKWASAEYDDAWQAHHMLGAGSFGRVGLWVKHDESGQRVDELAVKEAAFDSRASWRTDTDKLSEEAVLTHHVNKTKVENFVQLRNFKCYSVHDDERAAEEVDRTLGVQKRKQAEKAKSAETAEAAKARNDNQNNNSKARNSKQTKNSVPDEGDPNLKATKWLYYLEYAPHGDLNRLIARYRAWNRYLPEQFLWHVFDSLAKAIQTIADQPTVVGDLPEKTSAYRTINRNSRIIHFDIKPDNIFLGYKKLFLNDSGLHGGSNGEKYPLIKLADFGAGEFLSGHNHINPANFWENGTTFYLPPEQMLYGVTWADPPKSDWVDQQDELGSTIEWSHEDYRRHLEEHKYHFTQAMNVWNVGKVMYDLMTLSKKWDYALLSTQNYLTYERHEHNAIENFDEVPFRRTNMRERTKTDPKEFSDELTGLIQECMKSRVTDRIKARELFRRTQEGLSRCTEQLSEGSEPDVWFSANEINNMPAGTETFKYFEGGKIGGQDWDPDIDELLGGDYDPDWPQLQLPGIEWVKRAQKWRKDHRKDPNPMKLRLNDDGKIEAEALQQSNNNEEEMDERDERGTAAVNQETAISRTSDEAESPHPTVDATAEAANAVDTDADDVDVAVSQQPQSSSEAPTAPQAPGRTREEWKTLRVQDLKEECKSRNISLKGVRLKDQYIDKLLQYDQANTQGDA